LALGVAVLANTVLITRCVLSPGCLPNSLAVPFVWNLDWIIWSANRGVNWLICGFAIFRLLRSGRERGRDDVARPARLRGYGRCILYLASISVSYIVFDQIYRFVAPAVYSPGLIGTWFFFALACGILQVAIWAYVDARFAPYIGSLVSGGRRDGFVESWKDLQGKRSRVFLLFFLLEGVPALVRYALPDWSHAARGFMLVADLERFAGMPRGSLVQRLPDLVEFVVYVVVSNALCAGAMLVVYRRMRALSPEAQAAVFD